MDNKKVYRQTAQYALDNDELPLYRASLHANRACRDAIDKAISEGFDGMHLKPDIALPIIQQFGAERVQYVLANTVQLKDWDMRFSRSNRQWAESIPVTGSREHGDEHRHSFALNSHPAILDGFIDLAREAIRERPSVIDKLNKQSATHSSKAAPSKRREEAR